MELELKNLQKKLLEKHPNWQQDKARWIAMGMLGMLNR